MHFDGVHFQKLLLESTEEFGVEIENEANMLKCLLKHMSN
jgi:hypothetical protein